MARFGAHAFIWRSSWDADSALAAIHGAAAAGLDFIEIPLLRPESFDAPATQRLLEEAGIAATCSLGLPVDAALPDQPERAVAFLARAVERAHRIGAPVVSGVIYGTLGGLPGRPPTEEELETVALALREAARNAATLGVRLGIEPVNRYETHLVNTVQQGLDLLEAIDAPNVFLHLDTYHMNIEEKGFAGPIEAAGKRLKYIHLSESDRGTPGTGNVHWDDVMRGLAAVGYDGDLVMESFVDVNPDIARATCMWRPVAPDSATLVRDGLAFLRGKATEFGLL